MTRRRGTASLVASPVLVGAVTVLITIIAVFIAYNANQGLPFVPTYDVKADIPSGNKLVKGNEVRVGGFRVGVVDDIQPKLMDGKAIAEISMKLDKTVEPLSKDTTLRVRPRSALGLKYVEVTPGRSKQTYAAGDTIPLKQASEPLELEDVFSTFDGKTRRNSQGATQGFGDAFAGRGTSINEAIQALNPLFKSLTPVMRNLSDPDTRLDNFFRQLGRASAQAAPVARTQAVLFTNMADTFAAISSDPVALQQTIEKSPPTIDVSVRSFRVQRPFLADFADLSRRLRPAAQELPRALPKINEALRVGIPVLPRTVELNNRLEGLFSQLDDLFENPATLMTLRKLHTTLAVTRPAMEFIAPYQTVCNYANYFLGRLGEHQSQANGQGTTQNQGVKLVNNEQPNTIGNTESSRPWDVPPGEDPRGANDPRYGGTLGRLYSIPYQPAIDAQGNADCQNGQDGYIRGPLAPGARYGRGFAPDDGNPLSPPVPSGGNFPVTQSNFPILSGGTYATDRLGIKNLRDVP